MATLHVIPHDDEHSVQKNKRLKLNSRSSLSNESVSIYVNDGPIRGTTLFEDSLDAFEDVISLTHTIGSSIVLHEAFQVNNRVVDYQYRQQIAAIVRSSNSTSNCSTHEQQQQEVQVQEESNCRRKKRSLPVEVKSPKTEEEEDEMATESNDTFDEECNECNRNPAVVEKKEEEEEEEEDSDQDHQQHEQEYKSQMKQHSHDNHADDIMERRSILRQACRMKRLTNLFRNLNRLQSLIVHEINSCMIDTDVHEFQFQQRQLQQQQQQQQELR